MAAVQRQLQISKSIKDENTKVLVISRKGIHSSDLIKKEKMSAKGCFEEIDYVFASGTPLYPQNFLLRSSLKIIGFFMEAIIILKKRITTNINCIIVNTTSLNQLKYYWFLSRLINIKLVYDYVEYMSSVKDRSVKETSTDKTFDTEFLKYADSLIVISSFLARHVKKMSPNLPYVVVPPIMDFEKFSKDFTNPEETDYFFYCGSTQYTDVVEFLIESYRKTNSANLGVSLILAVNGDPEVISALKNLITNDKTIKIISRLPYKTLMAYYKNAKGLLIPLQDNLQDRARFPFKISEYTASARPIITSNSGAIVEYFEDGKNALLAKTGDSDDFAAKLTFVLNNPEDAEQIAINAFTLGMHNFNYKTHSPYLKNLISQ